jgi:hypothetical protein
MPYRPATQPVGQPIVYQNADTNSANRIQSVSPQSNPIKLQYPATMNKAYQMQQPYQGNCSNLIVSNLFARCPIDVCAKWWTSLPMCSQSMPGQSGRSNMVSPSARQMLTRESSLSPLPQQQLQWHTPQINHNSSGKLVVHSNHVPITHMPGDDSYKITLPAVRSKPSVTPPTAGTVALFCVREPRFNVTL